MRIGCASVAAVVVAMVVACGGPTAPAQLTCTELEARVEARLGSIDRSCTTVEDCTRVGGSLGGDPCACSPSVGTCLGEPASRAAVSADPDLPGLLDELEGRCADSDELPSSCDCGWIDVDCVAGQCAQAAYHGCGPDAGVSR